LNNSCHGRRQIVGPAAATDPPGGAGPLRAVALTEARTVVAL